MFATDLSKILKKMGIHLFCLLVLLPFFSEARICVLAMFPKSSDEAKMIQNVFQYYHLADIYMPAQIADIQGCFEQDQYEEIIWVGHGASRNDGLSDYSAPILRLPDGSKMPLTSTFFQRRLSPLSKRSTLKKVRLNFCNPYFENREKSMTSELQTGDFSTLDGFVRQLNFQGVQVDIAPELKWASSILSIFGSRDKVSSLRYAWLSQSLNSDLFQQWATHGNGWCESDSWPHCDRKKSAYSYPTQRTHDPSLDKF
jgi:hypothetical protein